MKNPKSHVHLQIMARHSAKFQINPIKDVAGVAGTRSESARAITPSEMAKTKIKNHMHIFVIRQLQEKYLAANKRLYMAFVDLEKAFDQVPWKVIWWALRKLGVDGWIVRLVCVGEGYSEEFEVKVGVHQGSVLNQLLFIIVLEALSCEFCCGVLWKDLNADDLANS